MASFPRRDSELVFDLNVSGTSPSILELQVPIYFDLCRREGYVIRMLTMSAETFIFVLSLLPYTRTIYWVGKIDEALILDNLKPLLRRPDRKLVVIKFSSSSVRKASTLVRTVQAAGVHVFCGPTPLPRTSVSDDTIKQ